VREREIWTLEQIMVTPIRPAEFILGKTLPFFLIGLFDVSLIAVVGTLWFQVPFRGQVSVLFIGAILFLLCMLGVGLLISTVSATQQQAMVTAFFFLMPATTFSGFAFPISTMPQWLQYLTYANPLRYFLIVLRGTYLKGSAWISSGRKCWRWRAWDWVCSQPLFYGSTRPSIDMAFEA
jgi:ABC-2 type transport system permease protein